MIYIYIYADQPIGPHMPLDTSSIIVSTFSNQQSKVQQKPVHFTALFSLTTQVEMLIE